MRAVSSVCLSHRSTAAAVCGGFAAERPDRRYRSTAGEAISSNGDGQQAPRSAANAGGFMLIAQGRGLTQTFS